MGKRLIVELTDTQYNNILTCRSINIGRAPYKGIIMSAINAIKRGVQVPEDIRQELKTGRWIKDDPWTKPWCSECGESCIGAHGFDYVLTKCCPNCGIKMESEMELNFSLIPPIITKEVDQNDR